MAVRFCAVTSAWFFYNSRRPSIALCIVTSSAYSMSLPAGMPVAMRVTFSPDAAKLAVKDK